LAIPAVPRGGGGLRVVPGSRWLAWSLIGVSSSRWGYCFGAICCGPEEPRCEMDGCDFGRL